MKFCKISAAMNQGIIELFETITKDIIFKMNDEELVNRSRSIKLGYNNPMIKNEEILCNECFFHKGENSRFLNNNNKSLNDPEEIALIENNLHTHFSGSCKIL